MQLRLQGYADNLCFAVGVSGEIDNFRPRFALRKIVLFITRHACDVETFHVVYSAFAVAVHYVVDGADIVLLEDGDVQNIRTDEQLFRHTHDLVFAVAVENDDIVDIRTIEQELVFLQACAHKTVSVVDVQLLVGLNNGFNIDIGKVANLGLARIAAAVLLLEHLKPCNRIFGQMVEVVYGCLDLFLQILHQFVSLLGIELGDADHADIKQTFDIFGAHFANQFRLERLQSTVHKLNQFFFA